MFAEWRGRTVHLLKKKSKPQQERKKRKQQPLGCLLEEFIREKEGPTDAQMETGQQIQTLSLTD